MDYTIKNITTDKQLENALEFARNIFGEQLIGKRERAIEEWHKQMEHNSNLLLYAESDGELVGIVFGSIGDDNNMTVGIVAVDERIRKRGVAREMMLLLEERAKNYGIHLIALGAVQPAEGFYAKLGYTGSLLIQSQKHSIDELLSLNEKYPVNYTRVHDGIINQINLAILEPDREFQRKYEAALPGCYTQMMFWKNI